MNTESKTDEKIFTIDYAGEGDRNHVMRIKASEDGLEIDESATVPWDWILKAHLRCHLGKVHPQKVSSQPQV